MPAVRRHPDGLIVYAKPVHVKKASRHFTLGLTLLLAIVYRRITDAVAEQRAERTEALKTYFEAHVGDRQPPVPEQLLCLFNASVNQILVGSGRKLFAKPPDKMIAGQARLPRNLFQIDRLVITLVDEGARATESLVNLTSNIDFDPSHFLWADFTAREWKSESEFNQA